MYCYVTSMTLIIQYVMTGRWLLQQLKLLNVLLQEQSTWNPIKSAFSTRINGTSFKNFHVFSGYKTRSQD